MQHELDLYRQPDFDGSDYKPDFDKVRLTKAIKKVFMFMMSNDWVSIDDIAENTGVPHSSASTHTRNLRKEKFGSWEVEKRKVGNGFFEFRLTGKHITPNSIYTQMSRLKAQNQIARKTLLAMTGLKAQAYSAETIIFTANSALTEMDGATHD